MHLEPETIDGLELEMRLARNPEVAAAREDYFSRMRDFRAATIGKSKKEMIAELKAHNPAYILELLEKSDEASLRDRYVRTFMPRRQQ